MVAVAEHADIGGLRRRRGPSATNAVSGLSKLNRSAPMISALQPGRCGNAAAQADDEGVRRFVGDHAPGKQDQPLARSRRRQFAEIKAVGQHDGVRCGASTPSRTRLMEVFR